MFMHNTTGYMVGKDYEQGGIIKHGALMINAVSNSKVPHLGVIMGASYGAGNYGMSGRAYDPRFLFSWPIRAVRGDGPAAAGRRAVDRGPRVRRGQGRGVRRGRRQGHARDGRGADRVRADRAGQQLARLRRRHHRPARHAHRAGHGAERGAQRKRSRAPRASASSGCERARRGPWSPTGARSPAASSAPAAGWASAPWPCTPRPTPRRCSCARPTARWPSAARRRPTPTCAATRWCRPRWTRAPTPSTPATASWPRTRRSRARCPTPGLTWIGPAPEAIEAMGSKTEARDRMESAGVPVLPGPARSTARRATRWPRSPTAIGYPLLVKAIGRRRRQGHAPGRVGRRAGGAASRARAARPPARSATTPCSWSASRPARATWRSRSSATWRARWPRWASATARCSAATRR